MSVLSDLKDIKKRLLREDKVEKIFEAIGCEYISIRNNRVEAQLPARFYSDNKRSVQCRLNDNLSCFVRNKLDFKKCSKYTPDIFTLVSYIHHDKRGEEEVTGDLYEAKRFICETLGWVEYLTGKSKTKRVDYVAPLRALKSKKRARRDVTPNPVHSEEILNDYYYKGRPLPYKGWIEEGISYRTQMMYGIGFDLDSKRVTIPMRNRFGQLVGVKGRIMKNEDSDMKYMYLVPYLNSIEWFNFHYALPYILMEKKVYIFEAEKSPMMMFDIGIFNTLAIGSSDITPEQIDIIKQLGLDIEIVLCYDKGTERTDIIDTAKMFGNRKASYIFDMDNLLNDKDSPIDRGIDVWNKLISDHCYDIE